MVVNHYLVSGIQVAGLVIGTLGVFYLSQGIIGTKGSSLLQRVVIGLAFGLFSLSFFAFQIFVWQVILALIGNTMGFHSVPLSSLDNLVVSSVVACIAVSIGLFVPERSSLHFDRVGTVITVIGLLLLVAGYIVLIPANVILHVDHLTGLAIYVYIQGVAFVFYSAAPFRRFIGKMSERTLQLVGLSLTLLGIATQFIPPVLDLLNIAISK